MPKTTVLSRLPPAPARLLAPVLAAILLLSLAACATTQAPANSLLSGRWRLDPAASDDVGARVAQAIDSAKAKLRKRRGEGAAGATRGPGTGARRGGGGPSGGASGDNGSENGNGADESADIPIDEFGNVGTVGPDFKQLRERLLEALGAPSILTLSVQPDLVDIQHDNLPARDYRPGETFMRFEEYGTARFDSRWSGNAFVLRERYTSGAKLIERYEVDPHDGTLKCTRSLEDPTIGKLELKSVYHRA